MAIQKTTEFNFSPGGRLIGKYEIVSMLGRGWESEVYLVKELNTGIIRAAKFFYPERNVRNKNLQTYARKLYKLRDCPIVIQYHTQEEMSHDDRYIHFMVSEYVKGELLTDYLNRQPGKRMGTFAALHFLFALAKGMDDIHRLREYHGDLHSDNIIITRLGLEFELKIIDFFHRDIPKNIMIVTDLCDIIKLFYDVLGGAKWYAKHPPETKDICKGLKWILVLKKFPSAGHLKRHLESLQWDTPVLR